MILTGWRPARVAYVILDVPQHCFAALGGKRIFRTCEGRSRGRVTRPHQRARRVEVRPETEAGVAATAQGDQAAFEDAAEGALCPVRSSSLATADDTKAREPCEKQGGDGRFGCRHRGAENQPDHFETNAAVKNATRSSRACRRASGSGRTCTVPPFRRLERGS